MNNRKGLAKKIHMSPCSFWHTEQFCHIFTPVGQLLCSILHKNGPTTYNEHFTAYNIMALVCAGWLHEVQWVLCTAFWSMDMTGVYACLFEAVCDVTNCFEPSGLGGFVRRYLSAWNLRKLLPLYHVPCHTLYSVIVLSNNTPETTNKDCQMPVYQKADIGELIQWVTHESRSNAASNSGSIRIRTQPQTADAWHQWLMPAARRRHQRFFGHFGRLFDRLLVRISTSDIHHWIVRKKIFHVRAYDFGVQFFCPATLL